MFRKITDEDASIMGFTSDWCRPDWLICTVLPVPPPAVRPSIKQFNGMRSEDDITHKLVDILKTNLTLARKLEKKETSDDTIEGFIDLFNITWLLLLIIKSRILINQVIDPVRPLKNNY